MEAIQFWGGHKALYGNRKKIVFNAEAFDKAFLHHLFIKIQSIKMNMWKLEAGWGMREMAWEESDENNVILLHV
jgi:hypothetical protein